MGFDWKKGCCLYMVLCVFITIIIIISICVDTVEPIEYGLLYNSVDKKIDDTKIYDNGWYFLSPTESFITFPKTQVNLDFNEFKDAAAAPIQLKDNIGQEIKFQFSMQYKLHKESVGKLYNFLRTDYERTFIQKIDFSVREVVGKWQQDAFWNQRKENIENLRVQLNITLQELYADCVGVQVINIKFGNQREKSLIMTQVTNQKTETKQKEQEAKAKLAEIKSNKSEFEKNITIIKGQADAKAAEIIGNAKKKAAKELIDAQNKAYEEIKRQIKDGSTSIIEQGKLGKYLLYSELQSRNQLNIMYNVKNTFTDMRSTNLNKND